MNKKPLVEPFIVTIDDQEGGFELVYWSETHKDAKKFYDELDIEAWQEYPDKQGRHKRFWKLVESTQDTSDSRIKKEAVKNCESCGHVLEKVTRGYYCWHCGDETLVTHEVGSKEES